MGWQKFVQYIHMLYLGFIDLNQTVEACQKIVQYIHMKYFGFIDVFSTVCVLDDERKGGGWIQIQACDGW